MVALFVITGPSGAGKSTIIKQLQKDPPIRCEIYDFDWINVPYDNSPDWEWDTFQILMTLVTENEGIGINTVVGGLIRPHNLLKVLNLAHLNIETRCCLLKVSIDKRRERIMNRKIDYSDYIDYTEVVENLESWTKKAGFQYISIDTVNTSIENTVKTVNNWILRNIDES